MKKRFSLLVPVLFLLLNWQQGFSQAHLQITRMTNYPELPNDTAQIGQVYSNIHVVVKNVGNSNFFGDIHAYLYSQSLGSSAFDTLRDDPFHPYIFLGVGDSASLQANPFYQFRLNHYAAGDNIVVVWPYSGNTPFDTHTAHIFFSATTVGIDEAEDQPVVAYPNPATDLLRLDYPAQNRVEQVRISDALGRVVYSADSAIRLIDVSTLKAGVYILEIRTDNGILTTRKLFINHP